jgi:hypothetical protein
MFTRNRVIMSHNIKTPLTSISRAVGNILQLKDDQLIKSLFANNEQGFFYDPNDLSTMFQDSAGTIPVAAVGQPVGLMLDKSRGLALSSERNSNQNFDNLNGWTTGSATTAVIENSEVKVTFGGRISSSINWFALSGSYFVGKVYKVSFDATYISGGYLEAGFGYQAGIVVSSNSNAGIKTRYTFTSGGPFNQATYLLAFSATTAGSVWKIDNVSVKEVLGNHAFQTTSAARPILRKNAVTGANYLEFDGSDDFLQTSNIDFTSTDKVSLFTGVRKLSDASVGMIAEFSNNLNNNVGAFYLISPLSAGAASVAFGTKGTTASVSIAINIVAPKSFVMRGVGNISGDVSANYTNGVLGDIRTTDQGTGNYGNYPLYIGRRAGTSLPFNGHIYGLIGVGKLTSDSETIAIEKELAKRAGVTL